MKNRLKLGSSIASKKIKEQNLHNIWTPWAQPADPQ
jgi:hypothetical protein